MKLPGMKFSLLRTIKIAYMLLGIAVGAVFPLFSDFFISGWKEGMYAWFYAACVVTGGSVGMLYYATIHFMLVKRLGKMSEVAHAIINKDLTHRCVLKSDDALGEIGQSFNTMSENLQHVMARVNEHAQNVANSVHRLQEITSITTAGASEQLAQAEHINSAMNEMATTAEQATRYAADAAAATNDADEQANSAKLVMVEAMGAVDILADTVNGAQEVIKNLGIESENIGQVLSVINGIAEQTNLLALNAAIEAARAGEQGRGFAVVADEVRTLATRTQESTEEISAIIERLQNGAKQAVSAMENGSSQAAEGVEMTEKAVEALAGISGTMNIIKDMNTQIASAAEEQSAVAQEIKNNSMALNELAEAAAEGANSTRGASDELQSYATELESMVAEFRT